MMSNIHIRPMHLDDLPTVLDIEYAAYAQPWTHGIFEQCLQVGYPAWVIVKDETIVGYCVVSVSILIAEMHILNVCVSPAAQYSGLGAQLVQHSLDAARQLQIQRVFLEVRVSHERAIRLYQRFGFTAIGLRKDYYEDYRKGREDALVMALDCLPAERA